MKIFRMELKNSIKGFCIWTASIAFLVAVCIIMFPEMKTRMDSVNELFASMGSFSAAFGMDRLGMGTLLGFYAVECGTMLGLGAALFSAVIGIVMVSKEEKGRTAEFLFSQPVSRRRVLCEKYLALLVEVLAFHIACLAVSVLCVAAIGETVPFADLLRLHSSYLILSFVVVSLTFALSVFPQTSGMGTGMGLVLVLYFMSLIANITEKARFLSWLTPFSFTDGATIVLEGSLDWARIGIWVSMSLISVISGVLCFENRDLKG